VKLVTVTLIFTLLITGCSINPKNNNNDLNNFFQLETLVYDNLTLEQLAEKLERNLNSSIKGYGMVFAQKTIELGLDPYLAVAIMLHETGCKWNCSALMQKCNNVGGMKGKPGCNGGSYKRFDTLEDGIESFLSMLYNKYYSKGYTTPEVIGSKYAADPKWPIKVNNYIE